MDSFRHHTTTALMAVLCEADDWASDGFLVNIEQLSVDNQNFRRVLFTTKRSQLVVMSLKPGEDIGEETHQDNDQFIRVEEGSGTVRLNGKNYPINSGSSITIPAGTKHNITAFRIGLKLYTIYSPPHHRDGVIHPTKADAEADTTDEFDGQTTLSESYAQLKIGDVLHCQRVRTTPPYDWQITKIDSTRIHVVPVEGGPESQLGAGRVQQSIFTGEVSVS